MKKALERGLGRAVRNWRKKQCYLAGEEVK
jgi:hypothetical protein